MDAEEQPVDILFTKSETIIFENMEEKNYQQQFMKSLFQFAK
jgi:hypothetical protein